MHRALLLYIAVTAAVVAVGENPTPSEAAFPGDNGKIAYAGSNGVLSLVDIFVIEPEPSGSPAVNLTNSPDRGEFEPAWSPDGGKIAFRRIEPDDVIYVADEDGSNATPVAQGLAPSWSPDGTKLIYTRRQFSESDVAVDVFVVSAAGGVPVNLTSTSAAEDSGARWSPDGSRIVFVSSEEYGSSNIFLMNLDGSGRTQITAGGEDGSPEWSPDGQRIAFQREREIWVMDADGGNQEQLIDNPGVDAASCLVAGRIEDRVPSASTPGSARTRAIAPRWARSSTSTENPIPGGDIDCSGVVDPVDGLRLLRHDSGLSVAQAPGCPAIETAVVVAQSAALPGWWRRLTGGSR